uniref:Uncharacterized protein n=1 Tax=viral metagenome TaxID=1070528 RepID=A0A6M3KQJ4_9ZZZZ
MKTQKIEKTVKISDDISVRYKIEKSGQCEAGLSDDVLTTVSLYLPIQEGSGWKIMDKISFAERIEIMEEPLVEIWGNLIEQERMQSKKFLTEKYSQGFAEAESYILSEICKLSKALADRANALIKADDI